MKPLDANWRRGIVTDVHSRNNLSIDGMPRHILDVRRVLKASEDEDSSDKQEVAEENETVPRRSQRESRQPVWMRECVRNMTGSDCEQE